MTFVYRFGKKTFMYKNLEYQGIKFLRPLLVVDMYLKISHSAELYIQVLKLPTKQPKNN